ncbi:MAG: caspase family protein, partial [Bacteroidota bacterium]
IELTVLHNAGKSEILFNLKECCEAQNINHLIVYYAGHGCRSRGNYYLSAQDSYQNIMEETGLSVKSLLQSLDKAQAKNRVLIIDACYSGRATRMKDESWYFLLNASSTHILTSSPGHHPSYFRREAEHTYFTEALLRGMRQGSREGEKYISLFQLFKRIRHRLNQSSNQDITLPPPSYNYNYDSQLMIFKNPTHPAWEEASKPQEAQEMGANSGAVSYDSDDYNFLPALAFLFILGLFVWGGSQFLKIYGSNRRQNPEPIAHSGSLDLFGNWQGSDQIDSLFIGKDSSFYFLRGGIVHKGKVKSVHRDGQQAYRLKGTYTNQSDQKMLDYPLFIQAYTKGRISYKKWGAKSYALTRTSI